MAQKPNPGAAKRAPRTPALEPPAEPRFVRGDELTPELREHLQAFCRSWSLGPGPKSLRVALEAMRSLLESVPPAPDIETAGMRTPLRLDARKRAVAAHRGVLGELVWLVRQRPEPIVAALDHGRAPFEVVPRAQDPLHGRARRGSALRLAERCALLCRDCREALLQDLALAVQENRAAEVDALMDPTDRAIVVAIAGGATSAKAIPEKVPGFNAQNDVPTVRQRIHRAIAERGYDGFLAKPTQRKPYTLNRLGELDAKRWSR